MNNMNGVFWSRVIILVCLAVIGCLAFFPVLETHTTNQHLVVRFLDVGQGDAIHIQTPDGYEMLIDGGATSQVLRQLAEDRNFFDKRIDILVATHPDMDHIGGLVDVLNRYHVQTILQTNAVNETPAVEAYESAVVTEGSDRVIVKRGDVIQLGASTTITVLSPAGDTENWRSNAASIVVQVTYGDIEFLLTGDAPAGIEDYIAEYYQTALESEVLKLGHHGSDTSSSEFFLDIVQPQYAVVSAGADNRYGHPHQEVVDRVEERGIEILSTAESGTIVFETDGVQVWQVQ